MMDLDELYQLGNINDYFLKSIQKKVDVIPDDLLETYIEEAIEMTSLGIDNAEDQKLYFYLSLNVYDILETILDEIEVAKHVRPIIEFLFKHKDEFDLHSESGVKSAVALAAENLDLKLKDDLEKLAYPMGEMFGTPESIYSMDKWVNTTRDIYSLAKKVGLDEAFADVTADWSETERMKYKRFLNFYQEGAHNKYKIAQFVPTRDMNEIIGNVPNMLKAKLPEPKKPDVNEVRDKIETQRSKIIGRLNSAEKLLTSLDGQFFTRNDQEEILRMLHDLKRKIQVANKMTVQSSLFIDYIYRTANLMFAKGSNNAGKFFLKIAQEAVPTAGAAGSAVADPGGAPGAVSGEAGVGGSAAPEVPLGGADAVGDGLGDMGDLGEMDPLMDIDDSALSEETTQAAIDEFKRKLQEGVSDLDLPDSKSMDSKKASLNTFAQLVPGQVPAAPTAPTTAPSSQISTLSDSDDLIEAALGNVTAQDVIKRLEVLSAFFKKREISKQLAIVDLMMDKLGIGAFFPALGEATRSALESNSYVATRIDDILGKLNGAMSAKDADKLFDDTASEQPVVTELSNALKRDDELEAKRKENRKSIENAKVDRMSSEIDDLSQPTEVQAQEPVLAPTPVTPGAIPAPNPPTPPRV